MVTTATVIFLICSTGFVSLAYFSKQGCDPLKGGKINNPNQILPYFVFEILNYPAMAGSFIAMIICGSLSNLSSSYNTMSMIIWEDILKSKFTDESISEKLKTKITWVVCIGNGVVSVVFAFIFSTMKGSIVQILNSVVFGWFSPLLIYVTFGAISRRTSWKIVLIASIVASVLNMWIGIGNNLQGSKKTMLSTVNMTCSNLNYDDDLSWNITSYLNTTTQQYSSTTAYSKVENMDVTTNHFLYSNSSKTSMLENDVSSSNDIFILYQLSFALALPISLIAAGILTCVLCFIPGLKNEDDVPDKLLFPIIASIRRQKPKHINEQEMSKLNTTA